MFAQKRAKHFKLSIKLDFIKRTKSFLELGNSIKNIEPMLLDEVIKKATSKNPWFTEENIRLSMQGLLHFLEEDKAQQLGYYVLEIHYLLLLMWLRH